MSAADPLGFRADPLEADGPFDPAGSDIATAVTERLRDVLQSSSDHDKLTEVIELQLQQGRTDADFREFVRSELGEIRREMGAYAANVGRLADERTVDRLQRTQVAKLLADIRSQMGGTNGR